MEQRYSIGIGLPPLQCVAKNRHIAGADNLAATKARAKENRNSSKSKSHTSDISDREVQGVRAHANFQIYDDPSGDRINIRLHEAL